MISLQHSTIQTPDGATLAVYRTEKRRPGPSLVLAGGIAGGVDAWRLLIDDFAPFHQIISWDYRGLFRSSVGNRALRPSDVRIERHAADLALVLSELNVEQVVLIGWSMGARVALELARTAPQRVLGVVSINGAFGRPVQHALTPWIGPLAGAVPMLLRAAETAAPGAQRLRRRIEPLLHRGLTVDGLRLAGMVGETIDVRRFAGLMHDLSQVELPALLAVVNALAEHCAEVDLPELDVPVLLVAGERDPFTSTADVQRASSRFVHGDVLIVPSSTHFTLLEFAELLHLRIEKFLRDQVHFDRYIDVSR